MIKKENDERLIILAATVSVEVAVVVFVAMTMLLLMKPLMLF